MNPIKTSNVYELYLKQNIQLVKTLVIRLDIVAKAMNRSVMEMTGQANINSTDRRTWKYYQNICGTYHFTDSMMSVRSLDTGEIINFDKATLVAHPVTQQAYSFESYYYNELLTKYPNNELLIKGIISPLDIEFVVAQKDATILSYGKHLIEEHETELLADLQNWLYVFYERWVNEGYTYGNDLYVANIVAQLHAAALQKVINLRLRRCKTHQAHSFHVLEYLKSHGISDYAARLMSRKQQLTLYRNIKRYQRTSGQYATFLELVDVLLTEQAMPAYSHTASHDPLSIHYTNPNERDAISPDIRFQRTPINTPAKSKPIGSISLSEEAILMNASAPNNAQYHEKNLDTIEQQMAMSLDSDMNIKVIQATLDMSKTTLIRAPEVVVLNEWIFACASGAYRRPISYTPPGASVPLELSQQQAVALWIYFLYKGMEPERQAGLENYPHMDTIPAIPCSRIFRQTAPTAEILSKLAPNQYVTYVKPQEYLDMVVKLPSDILDYSSLRSYCDSVFSAQMKMRRKYSYEDDYMARAYAQLIVEEALTYNPVVPLIKTAQTPNGYTGQNYLEFLDRIGFKTFTYTANDFYQMAYDLFQLATGLNLEDITDPAAIQKAMLEVLKKLSSYSIQFVRASGDFGENPDSRPITRIVLMKASAQGAFSATLPRSIGSVKTTRDDVVVKVTSPSLDDIGFSSASASARFEHRHKRIGFGLARNPTELQSLRCGMRTGIGMSNTDAYSSLTDAQKNELADHRLNFIRNFG